MNVHNGPVRVQGLRGLAATMLIVGLTLIPLSPAQAADTVRDKQWHLTALRITTAHKITKGGGVIVAVIDSGVQADHPDLAGRVLPGLRIHGTARDDQAMTDNLGHGTGVAGLIVAKGGGPDHALGVAPEARILPVGVASGGLGGLDDIPQGLRWATDHGAGVVNISMSTTQVSPDLLAAVRYALAHDVVVVASAGNISPGDSAVVAPASIPGVVAVAGTTRDGRHWTGSATGPQIAVAAPSTDMETIANHDVYGAAGGYVRVPGGTSAAAPLVAGAAALVRAKYPHLNAASVIERLIASADDAGAAGRDEQYGYGRLNIVAALTAPIAPVQANPLGTPPVADTADTAGVADRSPRRPGGALPVRELGIAAGVIAGGLVLLAGVILAVRRSRRA